MSSAWKSIKDGASSLVDKTKGALKGDLSDIAEIGSVGLYSTVKGVAKQSKKLLPQMPDIPEPADVTVNVPEPPAMPGASPGAIGRTVPNVDLGATEGQRRTSGSAKGSRKLRVPLGGLGR